MSKTIDERVVEMRFDNKQFEHGVESTVSALDRLKKSLDMSGANRGLEEVNETAKKMDLSGLGSAVESVKMKFSALQIVAITALMNITNSVINVGKHMVKSLAIDPIMQGFSEYELKMGSIQTIMMSTGASLNEVNKYLQDLNTYSDKTIYSFQDMTSNIGKFTNAGVKLKDAVTAIQGVSNVAAVSGANANEASRAMYNFAQALSAGYVKLIDWKSIENANMATVEFKNQLLESAVACGTLTKTADGMYKTVKGTVIDATHQFNDSLSDQWMTTEALVRTLKDYADETTEIGKKAFAAAQDVKTFSQLMDTLKEAVGSGWANTWEILFGNFEEAKELWTGVNNVVGNFINRTADARNQLLQSWKDFGGRTVLMKAFKNIFGSIGDFIKPIAKAFREIFPATAGWQLFEMTRSFRKFTESLRLSESASENLKSTFKGLFAVLDILKKALFAMLTTLKPLGQLLKLIGGLLLSITASLGNAVVAFHKWIDATGIFQKASASIASILSAIVQSIELLVSKIKEKFQAYGFTIFHSLLERTHERISQIGESTEKMKSVVITAFSVMGEAVANSKFVKFLDSIWNVVKKISKWIVDAFKKIGKSMMENLGKVRFHHLIDIFNSASFGTIALSFYKFVTGFKKSADEFTDGIKKIASMKSSVVGILNSVKDCFTAYQQQLKAEILSKISIAIAILSGALVTLSLLDKNKLSGALVAITGLFADLMLSTKIVSKIGLNTSAVAKTISVMVGLATSVLILSSALKNLGNLDFSHVATNLVGVAGLMSMMVVASKVMSQNGPIVIKGSMQMILFATSIEILAYACKHLSSLNWKQLSVGLTGVGVLLTEVALFMHMAKFSSRMMTTAIGIGILASAITILAISCKIFQTMNWNEIVSGLTAIGILLGEITIFTNLSGNAKHVISTGIALVAISTAMNIFASAVQQFGKLSWQEIARGMTAMASALSAIVVAMHLLPKNMIGTGTGLVVVASSLVILSNALHKMGNMSWGQVATGLITLGGAMAILAVGLHAMTGTIAGSASLLVATSALAVLTPILSVLGAISWDDVAKGLIVIAGVFTILGVAGAVLTPLVPSILGLTLALSGLGVGLLAIGAGLTSISAGLTALGVAMSAGVIAIVAGVKAIGNGIIMLIPALCTKIAEGIIAFCKSISDSVSAIVGSIKSIILAVLSVLVACIPALADGLMKLIAGLLKALADYTPQIVDSIFQFLIGLLDGIARNLPALIKASVDVILAFFKGVADALKSIDPQVLLKGILGVGLLTAMMIALSAVATLIPSAMLGVLGIGGVVTELALVLAAIGGLNQIPGLTWLIGQGGNLLQSIGVAIGQFVGGIIGGFMGGVSSQFSKIADDLSDFMNHIQPFIQGASAIQPSMMDGVKALAGAILILTASSLVDGLASWFTGRSSLTKFAEQLVPFGKAMKQFSNEISGIDGKMIESVSIAGKSLTEMVSTLPKAGGVVGFFTGNRNFSEFTNQLVPFGKAMKEYGNAVAGLQVDTIQNCTIAGKSLIELANTVPNTGGVIAWFTGNRNLSSFGEQIVPFGTAMKQYSLAVAGMDTNVIVHSANVAKALTELANGLPNSSGIVSWFSGDNTMSSFGKQLASFGKSFAEYYKSISNMDISVIGGATTEFARLIRFANGVSTINTSAMPAFVKNLSALAEEGISQFTKAFQNANTKISEAVDALLTAFDNALNSKKSILISKFNALVKDLATAFTNQYEKFTIIGNTLVSNLIGGVRASELTLHTTFMTLVSGGLIIIQNQYHTFHTTGNMTITHFIAGIREKIENAKEAYLALLNACLTGIRNQYDSFHQAGGYLVQGFANGISATTHLAEAKAIAMAQAAARAARNALSIHSPSKVGYAIGNFFGLGFVHALHDYTDISYSAGESIGLSAKEGLNQVVSKIADFIESGIDSTPTIRPLLDLSQVRAGARQMTSLLSRNQAMSIQTRMQREHIGQIQNGKVASHATGNQYIFTQNNYSPKALSRIDIYRQTKNQFSAMKGMIET